LQLPLRAGLAVSLLAGLLCDANSQVMPGAHVLLFAAGHAVVFHLRDRLPRDQTVTRVIIALLANLGIFLVFSFLLIGRSPAPAAHGFRRAYVRGWSSPAPGRTTPAGVGGIGPQSAVG
jgi:rod shape-determining protein MreD